MDASEQAIAYLMTAFIAVFAVFVIVKAAQTLRRSHTRLFKLEKLLRLGAMLVGIGGVFAILAFGCWLVSQPFTVVDGRAVFQGISHQFVHRVFIACLIVSYSSLPLWAMAAVINYFRRIDEHNPMISLVNILN